MLSYINGFKYKNVQILLAGQNTSSDALTIHFWRCFIYALKGMSATYFRNLPSLF